MRKNKDDKAGLNSHSSRVPRRTVSIHNCAHFVLRYAASETDSVEIPEKSNLRSQPMVSTRNQKNRIQSGDLNSIRSSKDSSLLAERIVIAFIRCDGRITINAVKWRWTTNPGPKTLQIVLESFLIQVKACERLDSKSTCVTNPKQM